MPNRTAVTVVKIKNFRTGMRDISAHKLTTRAVEQPMISNPPMISPQRILLSSINELSTSVKDFRGGRGGCGGGGGLGSGLESGGGGACCGGGENEGARWCARFLLYRIPPCPSNLDV